MKKFIVVIILISAIAIVMSSDAAEKKVKKAAVKPTAEQTTPLVTEVMTKEELQAYLKEKGVPIITKANFKEPELVWERTFDEWIREVSDITEKGNCILVGGPISGTQPDSSLLFITNKGEIRQKINLEKSKENRDVYVTATVAKSGSYAAVFKISGTGEKRERLLSYYDEEGKKLWTKSLDKAHISILRWSPKIGQSYKV